MYEQLSDYNNKHTVYKSELATHDTNVNTGKKYNIRIRFDSSHVHNHANKNTEQNTKMSLKILKNCLSDS